MKRVGNLYNKLYTRAIMEEAYKGVMKDKKRKSDPTSLAFMMKHNKEYYIAEAARLLHDKEFKPRKPREAFRVDKGSGKVRHIQAPILYPDQLIHWALVTVLKDIFMKGMDHWCCASIKDRGVLYAKNFLEKALDDSNDDNKKVHVPVRKKYKYCLKMDIKKFFENIDRRRLLEMLEKKIKDKDIIELCRIIIYSAPGTNGDKNKGLPLGYYTSQWFANFYLQEFDHWLREVAMPEAGVSIYIRYMDDMVILGSNKRKLMNLMNKINEYIKPLGLWLKETSCVFSLEDRDIDFIGYRFNYGKTTLRKKILHNALKANRELYKGKFTLKKLSSATAYNGWTLRSDTNGYVEEHFQGNRELELEKLKELQRKATETRLNSPEYNKLLQIEEDIANLRQSREAVENNKVLIRYYNDGPRIVASTSFQFPDEEEYQEANKPKPKEKKKKRRSKNKNYYPTANIYFDKRDKDSVIKDYNLDIKQSIELTAKVIL